MLEEELNYGRTAFGLDFGIVSKIENGIYTILAFDGITTAFDVGSAFPLEGVYSDVVYKSKSIFGTHDVLSESGRLLHPLFSGIKLKAYIGCPIKIDNKIFGTVNFTSAEARKTPFSRDEINDMIHLTDRITKILADQQH